MADAIQGGWVCLMCDQPLDPDGDDVREVVVHTPDDETLSGLAHAACASAEKRARYEATFRDVANVLFFIRAGVAYEDLPKTSVERHDDDLRARDDALTILAIVSAGVPELREIAEEFESQELGRQRADRFDLSALWLVERGLAFMFPRDPKSQWYDGPVTYAISDKGCAFADWLLRQPNRRVLGADCDIAYARFEQRQRDGDREIRGRDRRLSNDRLPQHEGAKTVANDLNGEVWRLLRYPLRGRLLLDGGGLSMGPEDVDEILGADRYEWASVSVSNVPYGESFMRLALESVTFDELMVRMALAGRIGLCDTGVVFAMRAAHRVMIRIASRDEGLNDWADVLRAWAEVAEDLAADLEERYAEKLVAEASDEPAQHETGATHTRQAEAARERAARARRRRDEVRSDTRSRLSDEGRSASEIARRLGRPY